VGFISQNCLSDSDGDVPNFVEMEKRSVPLAGYAAFASFARTRLFDVFS
jgi:hypothetical protein